jgi:hypothetical protein
MVVRTRSREARARAPESRLVLNRVVQGQAADALPIFRSGTSLRGTTDASNTTGRRRRSQTDHA